MAQPNPSVQKLVARRLRYRPDLKSGELYEEAKKKYPYALRGVEVRQFHGRYVLPLLRAAARKSGPSSSRATKKRSSSPSTTGRKTTARKTSRTAWRSKAPSAQDLQRDQVRTALETFAEEIAAADTRRKLVRTLSGIDKHVDAVLTAAQPAARKTRKRARKAASR